MTDKTKAPAQALAASLQARHPSFDVRVVQGGIVVQRKTDDAPAKR